MHSASRGQPGAPSSAPPDLPFASWTAVEAHGRAAYELRSVGVEHRAAAMRVAAVSASVAAEDSAMAAGLARVLSARPRPNGWQIVFEAIEGPTWSEHLESQAVTLGRLLHWASVLAAALAALHDRNVGCGWVRASSVRFRDGDTPALTLLRPDGRVAAARVLERDLEGLGTMLREAMPRLPAHHDPRHEALRSIVMRLEPQHPARFWDAGELVEALERVAASPSQSRRLPANDRGPQRTKTPPPGTEALISDLRRTWDRARWAGMQGVVLTDDRLDGVSAVVSTFAAQLGGALVLHGRCDGPGATGLAPIRDAVAQSLARIRELPAGPREALRQRYRAAAQGHEPELARLHDELRHLLDETAASATHPTALAFVRAVAEFLSRLATKRHPLLIVLEEAHWLDEDTLTVLSHLSELAHRLPLMLVVTVDAEPKLRSRASWLCSSVGEALRDVRTLPRLGTDGLATLARHWLGGRRALDPALVKHLELATQGHPERVMPVLRQLIDEGTLIASSDRWQLLGEREPDPRRQRPIDTCGLRPATLELLTKASLHGRRFDRDDLAELGEYETQGAIAEAIRCDVLEALDDGHWRFVSAHHVPELRTRLAAQPSVREDAARTLATAWLELGPVDVRQAQTLVRLAEVLPPEPRISAYLTAGRRALAQVDTAAAERCIHEAVDALAESDSESPRHDSTFGRLHESLAEVRHQQGHAEAALEALSSALDFYAAAGDRARVRARRVDLYATIDRFDDAEAECLNALTELGITPKQGRWAAPVWLARVWITRYVPSLAARWVPSLGPWGMALLERQLEATARRGALRNLVVWLCCAELSAHRDARTRAGAQLRRSEEPAGPRFIQLYDAVLCTLLAGRLRGRHTPVVAPQPTSEATESARTATPRSD